MKNIILITMLMSAVFAQSDCNESNWKESYQGDDMTDCEKSSYKLFNTIDRNKNGKIGKKEFFRFYKKLKETEQLRILATYQLQLTVHVMRDIEMNVQGVAMTTDHITSSVIQDEIMPEVNRIWKQGDIHWNLKEVIFEDVKKENYVGVPDGYPNNYSDMKSYVENSVRDSDGRSDSRRLIPLLLFMAPENQIQPDEFGTNNFHIYIYPFIGNTGQGNAMRSKFGWSFGFHTVIGAWSNKHNYGGPPEKALITEEWNEWDGIGRGSMSRTIAHELGHVLGLKHNDCEGNCLMGPTHGYLLTDSQIATAKEIAEMRIKEFCEPLAECGYRGNFDTFFGN